MLKQVDHCKNIIDIGCGTGEMIDQLKKSDKCDHIYGTDSSKEAYEICRERFNGVAGITTLDTPIDELARQYPSYFDFVLFLDVIEHNDAIGIKKILESAMIILKPGGKVIITTPGITDMINILHHRFRNIPYKHLTGHSSYGWLSVVSHCGLKILDNRTVEFPIYNSNFLNSHAHFFGKCHMIIAQK